MPTDRGMYKEDVVHIYNGILFSHKNKWNNAIFSNMDGAAAAAQLLQACPTLCDPIDGSPPGSSIHGILQARILQWFAISFFNVWKWKVKVKLLSCVRLFATPWSTAYQAPSSMGFSRQEYWSGVPLPSLMDGVRDCHIEGSKSEQEKYHIISLICGI